MSSNPNYDPQKAHQYYEEHKHLKGRSRAAVNEALQKVGGAKLRPTSQPNQVSAATKAAAQARVVRLTQKVGRLKNALNEAERELQIKQAAQARGSSSQTKTQKRASY